MATEKSSKPASLSSPISIATVIILLGAALRFFYLDAQSMWFDEAARLLIAQAPLDAILTNAGRDTLPPFFHLTIHAWYRLGSNDFWLRLLPAFASLISVAVAYRLGRSLFDQKTGLLAALLMAIFPYQIFQAQQANLYSYLALFSGLQILLFYLAVTRNRINWWVGYALAAIGGMYTHYFAAFTLLTLHLWLLIVNFRPGIYRDRWVRLIAANVIAGVAFLPQLATFIRETGVVASNFWLAAPSLIAPLTTLHLFSLGYSLPDAIFPFAFLLVLALISLAAFELLYSFRRQSDERSPLLLIFMLSFLPIVVVLLISQVMPIYLERTLIIVTPAYCIFLGRALSTTHKKSPLPYLAVLTSVLVVYSLYGYYFDPSFSKPDYRLAAEFVSNQLEDQQVVLHSGNGAYLPFLLYISPENHFLLDGDPAPHHPPRLHELAGGRTVTLAQLDEYEQVWLVVAFDHSQSYQEGVIEQFDARYPLLSEANIDDIIIRQYNLSPIE